MIINMIAEISWDFSLVGVQGWTIFIIGWLVVFISLILLSSLFRLLPNILTGASNQKDKMKEKRQQAKANGKSEKTNSDVVTGELTAAIATALHLYFTDLHDDEARILKVEHKSRKYSPWNSKIYNVMNFKR
ncbi:MAG: OadG family protein [Bacteroidales bacterium]|jgi:Na+-transporting methylmalonyl-CoA/oxaloacetate decarboxylase gamma subunit|nr:OadG family protein [Bacteroidales bacterium]